MNQKLSMWAMSANLTHIEYNIQFNDKYARVI